MSGIIEVQGGREFIILGEPTKEGKQLSYREWKKAVYAFGGRKMWKLMKRRGFLKKYGIKRGRTKPH